MRDRSFSEKEIGVKAPATISGQLDILRERGLLIDDEKRAHKALETINYYRLVHYFAVFLQENGYYKEGTHFEQGVRLYEFDKRLRIEILAALEETEIAARAAISNYHSVKYGAVGYLNPDAFDRRHNHRAFQIKVERTIAKNANLSFVRHHNKKYGGAFPLWVLMEMFSFGALAVFFEDLKVNDKKDIAEYYFNHDYRNVENWLSNLAILRNRCAHYNRIYGNPLPGNVRGIAVVDDNTGLEREIDTASIFVHMLAAKALSHNSKQVFAHSLDALFEKYSDVVEPEVLGFPDDWREYL
ncbi:MAG: Abi family protein [Oscillospiraceae bacterium]|nr:Abi family protein [Oscillospiraceae bacterium]